MQKETRYINEKHRASQTDGELICEWMGCLKVSNYDGDKVVLSLIGVCRQQTQL